MGGFLDRLARLLVRKTKARPNEFSDWGDGGLELAMERWTAVLPAPRTFGPGVAADDDGRRDGQHRCPTIPTRAGEIPYLGGWVSFPSSPCFHYAMTCGTLPARGICEAPVHLSGDEGAFALRALRAPRARRSCSRRFGRSIATGQRRRTRPQRLRRPAHRLALALLGGVVPCLPRSCHCGFILNASRPDRPTPERPVSIARRPARRECRDVRSRGRRWSSRRA